MQHSGTSSALCFSGSYAAVFKRDNYHMLKGVVTLVPKQGDPTDIKNWRPVLNTDYKLITRSLSNGITTSETLETSTRLHGATTQKTATFVLTAVRTSNPTE
jgi:ABC-type sulfate transport system substrate-binding protein